MSLFQQFDDLRNTVNQLMGDFDMGLHTGGGGSSRRRGGRQRGGRRGDEDTDVSSCSNSACPCGDSCECGDPCSCGASTTKQQTSQPQPQKQSKSQPQRRQPRRQSGLDLFGFPSFGLGGGFFDEDILDLPLLVGAGGSDIGGGGATGTSGKAGVGKEDEEKKMVDIGGAATSGGEQPVATPQQGSQQVGTAQPTFKPDTIMRARVNIEDQPDKLIVTADLPGFSKENIKVNVSDDGLLTIKGEQTQEWKDQSKDKKYLRAERSFANVQRTIRVPKGVDVSKIGASYENGVLHVNLPKLPETEKQQQTIQIQ